MKCCIMHSNITIRKINSFFIIIIMATRLGEKGRQYKSITIIETSHFKIDQLEKNYYNYYTYKKRHKK